MRNRPLADMPLLIAGFAAELPPRSKRPTPGANIKITCSMAFRKAKCGRQRTMGTTSFEQAAEAQFQPAERQNNVAREARTSSRTDFLAGADSTSIINLLCQK